MAITINGNGAVTGLTTLPTSAMATGSILQVVQTFKADSTSLSANSSSTYVDISGMSVSITPSSSSSKILVTFTASVSCDTNNRNNSIRLLRGSTNICQSTAGSNNNATIVDRTINDNYISNFTQTFLDSPSTTSAITYKLQWACEGSGGNNSIYYLNRKGANGNEGATSTITAMEIKG